MCREPTASSGAAPNSPKASPTPSGAAIGVACASRGASPSTPEGAPVSSSPHPVLPGGRLPFLLRGVNLRAGVVFRCAGRTMRPRALPVALPLRGSLVGELEEKSQGPFPQTAHQCRRFPGPKRLPPMSPFRPRPLLALRTRLPGRHWSLGLAAAVQLPTRVRSHEYELGLAPEPVIHRSRQGHVPPIDFCSVWTPEHDHRSPDPVRLFDATVEPPRGG
jgi:hypothetical protein